ncbi:rhomboid-related protein 2 [Anopheles bellator]|uniref:rhomboid-related protein 2 n=1 Tax=Anopheles bellator TaxID=139047 RepID=UPI002647DFE4|nr:rhomboid-related protein 2 [Anopheles bellator]XP_058058659.1 rhomboid-related protein 2 [Anopheles bellator]
MNQVTDSRNPAKVVPVRRATEPTDKTATCQRAWIENDKCRQAGSEREPFLLVSATDEGGESGLECERLLAKTADRVFSIDLERGGGTPKKCDKAGAGELTPGAESTDSSTGSSGGTTSSRSSNTDDAKLVCDKLRKVSRRKRKPKSRVPTAAKLLQLCQCCPWAAPWSLLIVSALQIIVFTFKNDAIYRTLIFSPLKQYEIWRFVTYTFLHAGSVHLVLNIIIQLLVAFPLETEQGHGPVLLVYFAGVLAGGFGASVFEPTLMVGASAGVYCLLMSHIPHITMNFRALSYRYYRLLAVLVLCVSDVLYSIRHCLTKGNLQPRIGVAAHVCGAICGLLIGFAIYRPKEAPGSDRTRAVFRSLRYLAIALATGWLVLTVLYNLDRTNVMELL